MEPNTVPPQNASSDLADDVLEGAEAIAEFLFGSRELRRKVYYLAECSKLPVLRLGSVLCAHKSVVLRFISGQEDRVLLQERLRFRLPRGRQYFARRRTPREWPLARPSFCKQSKVFHSLATIHVANFRHRRCYDVLWSRSGRNESQPLF
ncbi:hypothetical protein ACVIGB_008708 [Bradyrhizobium sp. USDA 4341]